MLEHFVNPINNQVGFDTDGGPAEVQCGGDSGGVAGAGGPRPAHLTRLTLVSCQLGGGGGVARGGAELYLTVKCEGETHRSGRVSSSGDTVVWDFSVVLYRSHSSLYCNG